MPQTDPISSTSILDARLLNVYSENLFRNTDQWLLRCQTYEGGFGGCPGMEAHGGYSFCGLAALVLMDKERLCDLDTLLHWAAARQMRCEGGFQGRTNKLVDGCYSFWQGGIFPILQKMILQTQVRQCQMSRIVIVFTVFLFYRTK